MVNFGPLAAEIGPVVCGIPANFKGFWAWQPNFAALHLYSAERPSHWASAHILVGIVFFLVGGI